MYVNEKECSPDQSNLIKVPYSFDILERGRSYLVLFFCTGGQGADFGTVPDVELEDVEELDDLLAGDGLHGTLGLQLGCLGAQVLQFVLVDQNLGGNFGRLERKSNFYKLPASRRLSQ